MMKKKIASLSATAVVGIGAIAGTGVASANPADTNSQGEDCSKLAVVMAGGGQSLEVLPDGTSPSQVQTTANNLRADGYTVSVPSYNATPFLSDKYEDSVAEGKKIAENAIKDITQNCANPEVALVGYSQSADIMTDIINDISKGNSVIGEDEFSSAVLVASPHKGNDGVNASGTAADSGNGILGNINNEGGFGDVADRVTEVCNSGDYVCSDASAAPVEYLKDSLLSTSVLNGEIPFSAVKDTMSLSSIDKVKAGAVASIGGLSHVLTYNDAFANAHKMIEETRA